MTVTGAVQQIYGTAYSNAPVSFTPTNRVVIGSGGLIAGDMKSTKCTNGAFSIGLLKGDYAVEIPPRLPFVIQVTNDDSGMVVNITNLITTGAYWLTATNPIYSVVNGLVAGTNVTFQTNGARITINSSGTGGSGTTYTFTPTNIAAGILVTNGSTVFNGTNLADLATSAALTTVSNQVLVIAATNRNGIATYTNIAPIYDASTNTILVTLKGADSVPAGYNSTNSWTWNGVGYTNSLAGASKRTSLLTNGVVAFWANNTGSLIFTNLVAGQVSGIYRSNTTAGVWLEVTPTFTTNIVGYTTNLIRGIQFYLSDFGYRPDGKLIYSMSLSNGVAVVPGGQFTASDVGKWLWACTDAGATNFYAATIVTVNNSTNVTLGESLKSIVATNVIGGYGSGNYAAVSNALATTTGTVILKVPPGLGLLEQAVYDPQTGNNVVLKIPATQAFNVTNSQSRTIVIAGDTPAIIYPQFIVGGTSVRMPIDGAVMMNIAKPTFGASVDRNVFVQHSWSNRVTSVPLQFAAERVVIDNITFRQPLNNKFDGVWFDTGGTVYLNNVQVDKDVPPGFINVNTGDPAWWERGYYDDSTNANVGLWLPRTYNYAGAHLFNFTVSYYGLGAYLTEHTIGDGKISIVGCDTGAHFSGMVTNLGTQTGPRFNMFYVYRSRYPITVNTNCIREVASFGALQFETQGARVNYHITDPAQKFKFSAGVITGPESPSIQSTNGVWYDPINGVWHGNSVAIAEGGVITGASIDASQLTGTLPAINAASLTNLNASNLSSGTVPNARLTGVTVTNGTLVNATNAGTLVLQTNTSGQASVALNVGGIVTNVTTLFGASGGTLRVAAASGQNLSIDPGSGGGIYPGGNMIFSSNTRQIAFRNDQQQAFGDAGAGILFAGTNLQIKANVIVHSTQPNTNGLGVQGATLGCNGTNWWTVMRDASGVLSTNKFTLTTWP